MTDGSTVLCLYHKLFVAFVGIILEVVNRKLFGWFQYLICIWWHEKPRNQPFVILLEPYSIEIPSTAANLHFELFLLDKLISYHHILLDFFSLFILWQGFLGVSTHDDQIVKLKYFRYHVSVTAVNTGSNCNLHLNFNSIILTQRKIWNLLHLHHVHVIFSLLIISYLNSILAEIAFLTANLDDKIYRLHW